MEVLTNKYQTPIESLGLEEQPIEIQEQFYDCINNIPYIKSQQDVPDFNLSIQFLINLPKFTIHIKSQIPE